MINHYKNDINKIAVKYSSYAIVAQWQSTSLVKYHRHIIHIRELRNGGIVLNNNRQQADILAQLVQCQENQKNFPPGYACIHRWKIFFGSQRRRAPRQTMRRIGWCDTVQASVRHPSTFIYLQFHVSLHIRRVPRQQK